MAHPHQHIQVNDSRVLPSQNPEEEVNVLT